MLMPEPEQGFPPITTHRKNPGQRVFYPNCKVTLHVVIENYAESHNPVSFPIQATSVTIYSNSYKEADTYSITFDAKDLPISPELIKAGAAEIFLYHGRALGELPEVVKARDNPETPIIEGLEPTITGVFDEVTLDYTESGRTISIDGTDYTSLFLAKKWREWYVKVDEKGEGTGKKKKRRCPAGKPLDEILTGLMKEVDSAKAMSLVVEPAYESVPFIKAGGREKNKKDRKGKKSPKTPTVGKSEGKSTKKGLPVRDADTYWDVMYDLAVRYGFILFVRNNHLVLTKPQAYIDGRSDVRKLAWGKNLTSLRMSRRIGQEMVPIVEVRSYDSNARKIRKARYPKRKKVKPVTGLGTKRKEVRVYNVPNVRSEEQLYECAKTAYELLGRSEQTVEIETRDLIDLEGSDLINLRTGDALTIGFEPGTSDLLEAIEFEQRITRLKELGYHPVVAVAIAGGFEKKNQFKRPFRVKEASFDWDIEDGLTIQATLHNFVDIRGEDPDESKDELE